MPVIGDAGRYDEQALGLLEETEADAVVLLVFNGNRGHGFSVSSNGEVGQALIKSGALSELMRKIASDITTARPSGVRVDAVGPKRRH